MELCTGGQLRTRRNGLERRVVVGRRVFEATLTGSGPWWGFAQSV